MNHELLIQTFLLVAIHSELQLTRCTRCGVLSRRIVWGGGSYLQGSFLRGELSGSKHSWWQLSGSFLRRKFSWEAIVQGEGNFLRGQLSGGWTNFLKSNFLCEQSSRTQSFGGFVEGGLVGRG